MDPQVKNCPGLTDRDLDLLYQIETSLNLTADVSRADVLLCCLLSAQHALVVQHAKPNSISSLYRNDTTGRIFTPKERPLLFRALRNGTTGRKPRQMLSSGAPVIQDVYPIRNAAAKIIGALSIEKNLIEHERHRRRNRSFRRAVRWLQEMCIRREIENAELLSRFGPYDGVYLVDHNRRLTYMNGIATNMFRSIERLPDVLGANMSILEKFDVDLVEQAFETYHCIEMRQETEDGRTWIRKAIPLRNHPSGLWRLQRWNSLSFITKGRRISLSSSSEVDAVLVLVHNATESVRRQRELNVKSAIIQEVHHRVKNNLQTIAAILRIQARRCHTEEAKQNLSDAVNRILSMSVIHEFLSQDEHQPINIREVCQRIITQVTQVATGPDQQVNIRVTGPNIRLPASQATPASLVINELLLNAVEHGLEGRHRGNIEVQMSDLGDAVEVAILDDGNGLPEDFDLSQSSKSLGLQIVHTLVTDDLKGSLRMEPVAQRGREPERGQGRIEMTSQLNGAKVLGAPVSVDNPQFSPIIDANGHSEPKQIDFVTRALVMFPKRSMK